MKKFQLILFCLTIVLNSFGQSQKIVKANLLNIRKGPGKEYSSVGQAKNGDTVKVLSVSEEWTKIETKKGIQGYASNEFLIDVGVQNKNTEVDKKGKSKTTSWIIVVVILLVGIFALYRFLKSMYKRGLAATGQNKQQPNPVQPQLLALHWWHCYKCNLAPIQKSGKPNNMGCGGNNSTAHQWCDLGEVGRQNYVCDKCGIQVATKSKPDNRFCKDNRSFHQWTKL